MQSVLQMIGSQNTKGASKRSVSPFPQSQKILHHNNNIVEQPGINLPFQSKKMGNISANADSKHASEKSIGSIVLKPSTHKDVEKIT